MSLFLALLLVVAAPSEASLGGISTPEDRQALHAFSRCIVMERPIEVRALLATDFRDQSYGRKLEKVINKRAPCPNVAVPRGVYKTGILLWNGAFAEDLLRRDRILDNFAARTAHRPELPNIEARNAGEYMAFCVVRTNPAGAAALLRTDVATRQELDALRALGTNISGCVAKDTTAEFTRDALRALIATAAYRLALHNAAAPAGEAG